MIYDVNVKHIHALCIRDLEGYGEIAAAWDRTHLVYFGAYRTV